jgi:hypothetical protein
MDSRLIAHQYNLVMAGEKGINLMDATLAVASELGMMTTANVYGSMTPCMEGRRRLERARSINHPFSNVDLSLEPQDCEL